MDLSLFQSLPHPPLLLLQQQKWLFQSQSEWSLIQTVQILNSFLVVPMSPPMPRRCHLSREFALKKEC